MVHGRYHVLPPLPIAPSRAWRPCRPTMPECRYLPIRGLIEDAIGTHSGTGSVTRRCRATERVTGIEPHYQLGKSVAPPACHLLTL
jgi:hypothetical protein